MHVATCNSKGVDRLGAQKVVVVHEALGECDEPALADELAHERPRAHVPHVQQREELNAHLGLWVVGGSAARGGHEDVLRPTLRVHVRDL